MIVNDCTRMNVTKYVRNQVKIIYFANIPKTNFKLWFFSTVIKP